MSNTAEPSNPPKLGRRERKKAATRKRISDVATVMFLERGFDNVSVREIADEVDVSPTTVFTYFPQKEMLVFDEDEANGKELVAVIRNRAAGQSIADALYQNFRADAQSTIAEHGDNLLKFSKLVDETPALSDYSQLIWLRYEKLVADAIAEDAGVAEPTDAMKVFARFVLQLHAMSSRCPDPVAMLDAGFRILEQGWAGA